MPTASTRPPADLLGAVPAHPGHNAHPLVVYGDHRLCAGNLMEVKLMAAPHMHSQIELNHVLAGEMTYWFNGRRITVGAGRFCAFWGMLPHQVIARAEGTRFVCLYVPVEMFLSVPRRGLHAAIFGGAVVTPKIASARDEAAFLDWRRDLLTGDAELHDIVRQEILARLRRLDHGGWTDLCRFGAFAAPGGQGTASRSPQVERMLRHVAEHALTPITVENVAAAAGLQPNYAMGLFRRGVGMTMTQAIRRHRLDRAQSLLICTDMPVTAVAFESGFGSLSRFYEAFRHRFGCAPGDYRHGLTTANRLGLHT